MEIKRDKYLNDLINRMNNHMIKVVIGSHSRFLLKDIITEFRGRGNEVHIFPLT